MTTVRLTFRMAADSSRKGTLYFQIIHRNTVKTLSTRCRIFADEWDEPNSRIFIMSPVSARRTATLLGIRNRIRHEMQRLQRHNQQIRLQRTALQHCRHHPLLPQLSAGCQPLAVRLHAPTYPHAQYPGQTAHRRHLPTDTKQHHHFPQRRRHQSLHAHRPVRRVV